jgi:uncharacterized protein (UPF0147 family)
MNLISLRDTPPWDWPANAGETLLAVLRDHRSAASDRVLAASLAGDVTVMNDEAADLLLSIVQSTDEPALLRASAAISLGPALEEVDTQGDDDDLVEPSISSATFMRIQAALRTIHDDEDAPKQVRRRVLEASVRAPQDWHPDAIRAASSSDDEDWRLTAAFCMSWIRGFEAEILEMLNSRNPAIQLEAVRAAGNWQVDAAWPHIAALIGSEATEKSLLLEAIGAAVLLRPEEACPFLMKLAGSEDEEIAEAANEALLEPGYDEADGEDEDEDFRR